MTGRVDQNRNCFQWFLVGSFVSKQCERLKVASNSLSIHCTERKFKIASNSHGSIQNSLGIRCGDFHPESAGKRTEVSRNPTFLWSVFGKEIETRNVSVSVPFWNCWRPPYVIYFNTWGVIQIQTPIYGCMTKVWYFVCNQVSVMK